MGKIVTVEYIDDLEGVPVDAKTVDTVEFSYRGKEYSLVLTKKNGIQFDKDIARYINAAKKAQTRDARPALSKASPAPRRTTNPAPATRRKTGARKAVAAAPATGPKRTQTIREWAADNGHVVSARGRIPASVIEAYNAAH